MTDTTVQNITKFTLIGGPTVLLRYGGCWLLIDRCFDAPRDYERPAAAPAECRRLRRGREPRDCPVSWHGQSPADSVMAMCRSGLVSRRM
jgi:hypothetical protein